MDGIPSINDVFVTARVCNICKLFYDPHIPTQIAPESAGGIHTMTKLVDQITCVLVNNSNIDHVYIAQSYLYDLDSPLPIVEVTSLGTLLGCSSGSSNMLTAQGTNILSDAT